jgi:ATP-dependent DNA ligase
MTSIKTLPINDSNKPSGNLTNNDTVWSFPELIKLNKNGRTLYWQIFVDLINNKTNKNIKIKNEFFNNNNLETNIVGRYWTVSGLKEGKETVGEYTIIDSGKNLEKKNQTNAFTQCLMSARSIYNKYKQNYEAITELDPSSSSISIDINQSIMIKPMLAQIYETKRINFDKDTIYLQPKLDGLRCIYNNGVLYTRQLKIYEGKDYIKNELNNLKLPDNIKNNKQFLYFDGELYQHGMSLQDINSLGRKDTDDTILKYNIYDCFIGNQPELLFSERLKILEYIRDNNKFENIKFVQTYNITSFDDIEQYYKHYLDNNYEGVMIRIDYKYEINKRSYRLLKYKPINTEEFILIDIETGIGKNTDIPLLVLSAAFKGYKEKIEKDELESKSDLKLFKASLKDVSVEEAKKLYKKLTKNNKEIFYRDYYLRPVTTTYLSYSDDEIPRSCYVTGFLLD